MSQAAIFSIPVDKTNIGREFTKSELKFLLETLPVHKQGEYSGTVGIGEGHTNHRSVNLSLFDTFAEELKDITNFCDSRLEHYMKEIEGIDTEKGSVRVSQCWLNKTKPQEYHAQHFHANSYLSGVLYIKCLPKDGIVFTNRMYGMFNNIEFPLKKMTIWNAKNLEYNVKEGDLIIFPSWVMHSVNVNQTTNIERVSLSFDTFPTGEVGRYDTGRVTL